MPKKNPPPSFNYPEPLRSDVGCKVSWLYYADRETAEVASKVAVAEGRYREGLGYDFGYQAPGSINKQSDGSFRVCIP